MSTTLRPYPPDQLFYTRRRQRIGCRGDRLYREEARGHELPEELRRREDRLAKIEEAAQQRLEQRQVAADRAQGQREGDGAEKSAWEFGGAGGQGCQLKFSYIACGDES